jgi:hypothetical protein
MSRSKHKSRKGNRSLKFDTEAYVKASRHGEWQGTMENENGFVSMHKVHKNKKAYNRKPKHKNNFL